MLADLWHMAISAATGQCLHVSSYLLTSLFYLSIPRKAILGSTHIQKALRRLVTQVNRWMTYHTDSIRGKTCKLGTNIKLNTLNMFIRVMSKTHVK